MRRLVRALSLATCLAAAAPAAADLIDLAVERNRDGFDIRFEVTLDVPPEHVRRLFAEPGRWVALSEAILSSRHAGPAEAGAAPAETVFRDCILFLCREVRKVAVYRVGDSNEIIGRSVPGAGDFRHIEERWRVLPLDEGTRIVFSGRVEPDFRVPPVIGPMLIRTLLKRLLGEMERNLEAMAMEDAAREEG